MNFWKIAAVGLVVALGLTGCGDTCGPSNCDGCCDASGACQVASPSACGRGGNACEACAIFQSCFQGACLQPATGGNGGHTSTTGTDTTSSAGSTGSTGTDSTGATSTGSTSTTGTTTTAGSTGTHSTGTSSAASTSTTTGTGSSTTGTTTGTTGAANQPPAIVSLTANPTALTPGASTVISAIVSDPDGLSDLAGGTLKSSTGQTYGAFSTPGGQGTFTYSLSYSDMQALHAFDIPAGGGTQTVQAVFFDNHGHQTAQTLTLTVQCPTASNATCNGACTDLQADPSNCGACGGSVPSGGSCANGVPKCTSGKTNCGGTCINTKSDINNCGGCGFTCSSWASAHGVGTTHLGCDFSACVHYEDSTSDSSCTSLCASVGSGLTCYPRSSCRSNTGSNGTYTNGACGSYSDSNGTCVNEIPYGCDDVPAATTSACVSRAGGTVQASFSRTYCSCSG